MLKRVITHLIITATMLLIGIPAHNAHAGDDAVIVTMLDGSAQAFSKGAKAGTVIRKNDRLKKDQEVKTAGKSRVELRFPDGTIMRLSEKSSLKLSDVSYDAKSQGKNVKVNLTVGKLWANVKKLTTPDSRVEVKTVNAVAGVRGTVYRVNAEEDNSAMVKVYDGSVYVAGASKETPKPVTQAGGTVPVAGPQPVPPPYHEVTMEEWHVIVKSFQQITISPQGVPSQPQDFTPQQDMDDWVKWNQERDKQL